MASAQLQHHIPGQLHDAVIDQKEPGQAVPPYQRELLLQPLPNPSVDPPVTPLHRLPAQLLQPALGIITRRYRHIREGVPPTQISRQPEVVALFCNSYRIG